MKRVLFLSPGYPADMPEFVRGLAEVGVEVLGVGDQPEGALPRMTRRALSGYLQAESFWDEGKLVEQVRSWVGDRPVDRVECLWEVGMLLAARMREAVGATGLTVEQTIPLRNKERMKRKLDAAGIRVPRHCSAKGEQEIRSAADQIGYPLIIKPVSGAGSADTHHLESAADLERVVAAVAHCAELSVEEFIDGEEYTFDAISIAGVPSYFNIAWYRPRPLIARSNEWISPQVIALRHPDQPALADGVELGLKVLAALEIESGFTHMEWFMTPQGEVVFGEIGGRPPGAHQVEQMRWACDFDVYRGWAEAVALGSFNERFARRYNVATIYKRAAGEGKIRRIDGLDRFVARHGGTVVWDNLLPVGADRRNWKQTLVSDGFVMLRHPELERTLAIADEFGEMVQLHAA